MCIYRNVSLNYLNDKCFRSFQLQRKSNTHVISSICFSFLQLVPFMKKKRGGGGRTIRQATDDNIIRHLRFARRVTKYRIQKHIYNL